MLSQVVRLGRVVSALPRCIVLGACAGMGYVNILVRKADNWRAMEHT